MIIKFKILLKTITMLLVLALIVPASHIFAISKYISTVAPPNIAAQACSGATTNSLDPTAGGDESSCKGTQASDTVTNIIKIVVTIFSIIVGIAAILMIIVGGFKYVTSTGDPGKVSSAKNTILYALIGLVIVALAQFIVRFVLQKTADQTALPKTSVQP
ncbi:MAG: hypothetical protein NVS3B23_02360 [Candidatus Saccharimonadales bacterium]